MDPTKKKELSRKRRQNYQSLDGIEKKNYFTNIMKHINPWMRQRRKSYFRNAQKNTNQWIKKLKEIY